MVSPDYFDVIGREYRQGGLGYAAAGVAKNLLESIPVSGRLATNTVDLLENGPSLQNSENWGRSVFDVGFTLAAGYASGIPWTRSAGAIPVQAAVGGSSELEALYLQRASSPVFQAKLSVSNQAAGLVGGRAVSAGEITEALANTEFRQTGILSSVNQSGSGYIINGSTRGGYFAGEVADHELLHIGQFIRNPGISTGFPAGLVHEVIPSFVGSPVIYVGGTTVIVGGAYGVYRFTGDNK